MREEEKEDNKSISEALGLATEEKEKEEYEEDWRSQEAKEEIILPSVDESGETNRYTRRETKREMGDGQNRKVMRLNSISS